MPFSDISSVRIVFTASPRPYSTFHLFAKHAGCLQGMLLFVVLVFTPSYSHASACFQTVPDNIPGCMLTTIVFISPHTCEFARLLTVPTSILTFPFASIVFTAPCRSLLGRVAPVLASAWSLQPRLHEMCGKKFDNEIRYSAISPRPGTKSKTPKKSGFQILAVVPLLGWKLLYERRCE